LNLFFVVIGVFLKKDNLLVLLKCLVVFRSRKIKAKRYIVMFVCTLSQNIRISFNLATNIQTFFDIYIPFCFKKFLIFYGDKDKVVEGQDVSFEVFFAGNVNK